MSCPHQLCGACVELAELDATKPTPQNFLALIHKRHHIKSNVNLWHDHLASRLPVEIISHIFLLLDKINEPEVPEASEMSEKHYENWDHLLRTPMLLSSVCRKWRNIVLMMPQLWTKFLFNLWTLSRKLELLTEFLSRSGSLPLSLMLWGDPAASHEELQSTYLDPIVNLIRSYSSRWKLLDIDYVPKGFTDKLLRNLDPPLILQGLRVDYSDIKEPIPLREPLRPRHVGIIDMFDTTKISIIPLEWDNLTHLDMSNIDTSTLLDIVKQTPRLTKWLSDDIYVSFDDPDYPIPSIAQGSIIIPTLEHLKLTFQQNDAKFFSYLTLPALTHLECRFGDVREVKWELDLDDLVDFFSRSQLDSKSLQTFDLMYNIFGVGFDRMFNQLTAITHLSIYIYTSNDTIINSYLSEMSDISILPRLQKLHIQGPTMLSSAWPLLCNIFRGDLLPAGYETIGPSEDSVLLTSQRAFLPRQFHKRPLEHVSVSMYRCNCTSMPHKEYLFLRDIQKDGVVKLEFEDSDQECQDILQRMAQVFPDDPDS